MGNREKSKQASNFSMNGSCQKLCHCLGKSNIKILRFVPVQNVSISMRTEEVEKNIQKKCRIERERGGEGGVSNMQFMKCTAVAPMQRGKVSALWCNSAVNRLHWVLRAVQWTLSGHALFTTPSALYSVHCALSALCIVHWMQCALCIVQWALCIEHCALSAVCIVQYAVQWPLSMQGTGSSE